MIRVFLWLAVGAFPVAYLTIHMVGAVLRDVRRRRFDEPTQLG